jgi:hypothetical protein
VISDATVYIDRYRKNPELWVKEMIGISISEDQKALFQGLVAHNFVSAKSGTGTGKTASVALLGLWFLTTHPESKVVLTAPGGDQIENLLFAEIDAWKRRIKFDKIRESLVSVKGRVYVEGYRDWFIVGRTIPKDNKDKLGDVLAGFHAPSLLFLVDESSGVPDPVFRGIEGSMMQKNVWALLTGNPTRSNGYFYDTHTKHKDRWHCLTLSSLRSPFNDQSWIERMKNLHGEDSDFFRAKVLGEFPRGGGLALVSIDELYDAFDRWSHASPEDVSAPIVAGLDPAAGKNDYSILTPRKGWYIFEPIRIKHVDTTDLVPKVLGECKRHGVQELYIDYTGMGIGVYDQARKKAGFKVYKVISSARANDPEAYKNLRAELFMHLRDNFEYIALPNHDRYVQELPEINIIEDSRPLQIEDKKKIRSRLNFSPDYSDSLMISLFRHGNLVGHSDYGNIQSFRALNSLLTQESSFAKI